MGRSTVARVSVVLLRRGADEALSAGADPAASPLLAARAAQLVDGASRASLAESLERLLRSLDEDPARLRVIPHRAAVRADAAQISDVAWRLRHPPVYAQGVAMVRLLLSDGTGALYCDRTGAALAIELRCISDAVDGCFNWASRPI